MKKTTGGQWHSRQFKLEGSNLTWLKSDGKTTVTVDVSKGAEIRDIKIGPKKFSFDIILPGDTISVAASGEAEKAAWMAALKVAMGKRAEAEGILQKSGAGRASVRSPLRPMGAAATPLKPGVKAPSPAAGATAPKPSTPSTPAPAPVEATPAPVAPAPTPAAPSPASPATGASAAKLELGSVVSGGLATQAANAKLAAKIGGKLGPSPQSICVVCGQTVYKPEELIVDKTVMHKRCFQCNHCKRLLTMGNFACINGTFYCKVHYFELFSTNGGKYDKAFGDAGFKTKATTSYTPGEILQPGKLNGKVPVSTPPKAAASASATSPAKAAEEETPSPVVIPSSPVAEKSAPKKLEVKAPVSTKTVEKKEVEILPKKNMDDLRKMVVLPGMAPPKAKKEEIKIEEPKAEDAKTEETTPETTTSSEPAEGAEAVAAVKPDVESSEQKEDSTPSNESAATAADSGSSGDAAKEEAPAPAPEPEPEPQIQIVRPPAGINFALEAMKIRQAQLEKKGIVFAPQEEQSANEEGRASVRISGRLDHSAVMSKPRMAGRRAPKVQEVGKLLPKTDIDRMTHDWTFRVLVNGSDKGEVLIVHATSQFEKEHWVATIGANVYMLSLKYELEQAQKRDMMSALQAQLNLEAFLSDNKVTYSGFLEKVSMKSQRNWKKRWFDLTDKGELRYFENENSKKPNNTLQLTYLTKITAADGTRLDAPLVINTGATEKAEESEGGGQLPQNIAIFDNEDVTIALETLIPETLQAAADNETAGQSAPESETAGQSAVEMPTKPASETPIEPVATTASSAEASGAVEGKEDVPLGEPDSARADKPDEDSEKANTAWAQPGQAPDRVVKSTDAALSDSVPIVSLDRKNSRRKSGNAKNKPCVIM